MARKKKTETYENQISMFDKKQQNKKNIEPECAEIKNVSKGELLEYQIKRLLFFMGYYAKNNITLQTSSDEPYEIVTDLDVYGTYIHNDFSKKTIWVDCKSGNAQEISRVAWLNGIKEFIEVNDILFVKRNTKLSTKIYANKKIFRLWIWVL